jgi:hypothetical protein
LVAPRPIRQENPNRFWLLRRLAAGGGVGRLGGRAVGGLLGLAGCGLPLGRGLLAGALRPSSRPVNGLGWLLRWGLGTVVGGLLVKLGSAGKGAAGLDFGGFLILHRRRCGRH